MLQLRGESQLEKLKRYSKQDVCTKQHMKLFFQMDSKTKNTFVPFKAGNKIKAICPSINYTCCYLQHVEYLRDKVLEFTAYWDVMDDLSKAVSTSFEKTGISKEQMKGVIEKDKDLVTADIYNSMDRYFDLVSNMEAIIHENQTKLKKSFTDLISAVGCQICDYTFSTKLTFSDDDHIKIRFNFENKALIYESLQPIKVIDELLFSLRMIIEMYWHLNTDLNVLIPSSVLDRYTHLIEECENQPDEEFKKCKTCQGFLKTIIDLRGFYYNSGLYNEFMAILDYLDNILIHQGKQPEKDKYSHLLGKDVQLEVFPNPNYEENTHGWLRFYSETVGISMKGNMMNFESGSAVLSPISVLILVLTQV